MTAATATATTTTAPKATAVGTRTYRCGRHASRTGEGLSRASKTAGIVDAIIVEHAAIINRFSW